MGDLKTHGRWLRLHLLPLYNHHPLDMTRPSICLVTVLPRLSTNGLVRCRIEHTTTDCRYQCLSYVWGSYEDSFVILLRDEHSRFERPFQMTKNLFEFLSTAWRLQNSSKSRKRQSSLHPDSALRSHLTLGKRFRIDALCIDQRNIDERNYQVSQTATIYSRAYRFISPLATDNYFSSHLNIYWTRSWVIQEVALARKNFVLFENELILWKRLLRARRQLRQWKSTELPSTQLLENG